MRASLRLPVSPLSPSLPFSPSPYRYPFNAGFYGDGTAQHISNFTTTAQLLKNLGYRTAAIGKWDVGYIVDETTPTYKGFDTFLG